MAQKVMWISTRQMSEEQEGALRQKLGEDVEIDQYAIQLKDPKDIAEDIKAHDVIAAALPGHLIQGIMEIAEDRPVITAVSNRRMEPQENGELKPVFDFVKWEKTDEISVKSHPMEEAESKDGTTNVLWFSRHPMEPQQVEALEAAYGNVEINQVNKTIRNVAEVRAEIDAADVIAVVGTIDMQKQFLNAANAQDKPVLVAEMEKVLDGEDKFIQWNQLDDVVIAKSDYAFYDPEKEISASEPPLPEGNNFGAYFPDVAGAANAESSIPDAPEPEHEIPTADDVSL